MIDDIKRRLAGYRQPTLGETYHVARDKAAVLLPIVTSRRPELLLTLRASTLGAHAGEVAWPGGRHDPEDRDMLATALRETHEEIGIAPRQVEVVGELRPFISKFGLLVTPFVGLVEDPVDLTPNPDELEAVFSVPIDYLMEDPRTQTDIIDRHGERREVPVYHYDGYRIWGLTAMILQEFLSEGVGVSF
ncbi:MAG TPA: CoA pyrophosphatase [Pseudomonadales bacterium]|nr:CoA pyrophosphatase [Pseudomonadales bacterium]